MKKKEDEGIEGVYRRLTPRIGLERAVVAPGQGLTRPICWFRGKLKILYSTAVTVRHYY